MSDKHQQDEKIVIKDFVVLKDIEISLRSLNILIGPQANGKSLVAKLVAFFQTLSGQFSSAAKNGHGKRELDREILKQFEERFPRYSWETSEFEIHYFVDDIAITIMSSKKKAGGVKVVTKFSDCLFKEYSKAKKAIEKVKFEHAPNLSIDDEAVTSDEFRKKINQVLRQFRERFPRFFSNSIFIPSSRSFFANLQKNIFTFLASNIDIDPYIKSFGKTYEQIKGFHSDGFFRHLRTGDNREVSATIAKITAEIMDGRYEHYKEQDWIINKKRKVNVANASSGQQEALPMLLILGVWPFITKQSNIFIEEPEAHLFPTAQSQILSIISILLKMTDSKFFITTHSPYFLSGLNNLVYASDLIERKKLTLESFKEKAKASEPIDLDDVSAFQIDRGVSKSIVDYELNLVGADLLDEVSEQFSEVMEFLLDKDD